MFGREPRTKLPETQQQISSPDDHVVRARDANAKLKMKQYADKHAVKQTRRPQPGDVVLARQQKITS
ncbi:MAG: hypothetical protein DSY80_08165 [Desulfocapsa sp.]|nr:MAG: hypothetical protein DSY80_08165 [Desulfocapsa sp.]